MRLSPFVFLLLVVSSVPGLAGEVFAREDRRLERLVSIANWETKTYDEIRRELEEYLRDLHRAGRLDPDLILSVQKEIGSPTVFFSALKRLPRKDVQRLLAQCIRLDEKVALDTRESLARHLADVGQDCDDAQLFAQLQGREAELFRRLEDVERDWEGYKHLHYRTVLARSFAKSRDEGIRQRVRELAVSWAKQYRKMGGSEAVVGGLGRRINRLLAACATEEAHAQVLENLKCFCLVGDQMHAFEILAAAKYAPAYLYAKKVANDETIECPVWVAAVKMMARVQNENNTQDIIATIDKIVNSGDLYYMYRKELDTLKRDVLSAGQRKKQDVKLPDGDVEVIWPTSRDQVDGVLRRFDP